MPMSLADSSAADPPAFDLLAAPEVRRQVLPLSVETYHSLGEQGLIDKQTELIRGVVIEKMSQSPLHCYVVQALLKWLLRGLTDGWIVRPANPLTTADSEPEPDLCVVSGHGEEFATKHPTTAALVIEVAVSSEKLDRQKAKIYAEAAISEYWIVFPERLCVEVHASPQAGIYGEVTIRGMGEHLTPSSFPSLSIPVADLFPKRSE